MRKCHQDLAFMYISHTNCPNFRVLSDFRKDNYEFFKECFKQTVSMAIELGMISLGHVSLDGSKFKADTSIHKAMSYGRLKKKESELVYEIETLCRKANKCDNEEDCEYQDKTGYEIPKELEIKEKRLVKVREAKEALQAREKELNPNKKIEAKKQISFADKEACIMGKKGRFEYAYNGQTSVDSKKQIIIGQHLTQNANDKKEVEPALKEIKNNIGKLPDKMTMDNGYISGSNLETIKNTDIDTYIATGKGEKKDSKQLDESNRKLVKSDFIYDSENDNFKCPNGKILSVKSKSPNGTYLENKFFLSNCATKFRFQAASLEEA